MVRGQQHSFLKKIFFTFFLISFCSQKAALVKEAMKSLNLITRLKYEMQTSKPLRALDDEDADVEIWNNEIKTSSSSSSAAAAAASATTTTAASEATAVKWFDASWLLAECYLYRRVREALSMR